MEIIIQPDAGAAADVVAQIIAGSLRSNPRLRLGLATGRTVESVYYRLVRMHREQGLDFSGCSSFNLDEYIGLSGENRNSYRHYMNEHLFAHVNIDLGNTHLPDGMTRDVSAECVNYERRIHESGGVDLQLLGIGRNGHLGFNEPLSAFRSRTRAQKLSPMTLAQNAPLFQMPDQVPNYAITMGVGTILECKHCLLMATGEEKAAIIAKAIEGPITSMVTATALQLHAACTVVLDRAAASQLGQMETYIGAAPGKTGLLEMVMEYPPDDSAFAGNLT
jgi:glucosamine-6-phosphate deaminase